MVNIKTTQVVLSCDEDERGSYTEKNARCGLASEKKKRAAKPTIIFSKKRYLYYNSPQGCRHSQTAGRNSCSIASGDVSN